jgi:glycerol-3-phosphate acyltransferase PlsY
MVVSAIVGYLIGSLPSADLLGRLWGVDLRGEGSRNPGTNNARRLGGMGLALGVLAMEVAKGVGAVAVGIAIAGDAGAVTAGIGAVAGNVYNIWYRFGGGKGLGISLGVVGAAWPTALPLVVGTMIAVVAVTRSSGAASLSALLTLNAMAIVWIIVNGPTSWGIDPTSNLVFLSLGIAVVLMKKHSFDFRNRQRPAG